MYLSILMCCVSRPGQGKNLVTTDPERKARLESLDLALPFGFDLDVLFTLKINGNAAHFKHKHNQRAFLPVLAFEASAQVASLVK